MSGEHENPYDPIDLPSEPDLDVTSGRAPEQKGNRPAAGARQATPGEVLSDEFEGGGNAGDFLGLDLEFDAGAISDAGLDLDDAPEAATELELGGGGAPAPVGELGMAGESGLFGQRQEPSDQGEGWDEEGADALEGDEDFGLGAEIDPELDPSEDLGEDFVEPTRSRRGLLVGVAFAAGIAAVGVVLGRDYLPFGPSPDHVAVAPHAAPHSKTPKPAPAATPPATAATPDDGTALVKVPIEDLHGAPQAGDQELWTPLTPPGFGAEGSAPTGGEVGLSGDPLEALTTQLYDALSAGADAVPPPAPHPTVVLHTPALPGGAPDAGAPDTSGVPAGAEGPGLDEAVADVDWAQSDSFDITWKESAIPMEAIHSPIKVMFPKAGDVAVTMSSGEVFTGRLVAMGEELVWIDAKPGRLGLDGALVAKIERIESPDGAGVPSADKITTGSRVRVRVPGGSIEGQVISSHDGQLILRTDDGAKITLSDPTIEAVGSSRVRLISKL